MAEKDPCLSVSHTTELLQNDHTARQKEQAARIEQKQKQAAKKAEEAASAASAITARFEELSRKAKAMEDRAEKAEAQLEAERKENAKHQELLHSGLTLAESTLSKAKNGSVGSFLGGLVLGVLAGFAAFYFLLMPYLMPSQQNSPAAAPVPLADADLTIDNHGLFGYTAADFQDAILESASEHQELIVMEQPLSISTTITKAGLASLPIFSKMKDVTYYGTGVYTVDLSGLNSTRILVDDEAKTVLVLIPHARLQYVNAEVEKTEFEDTEHGILAFGELKLTAEETKLLETSVHDAMTARLSSEDVLAEADRFAKLKTWEIFQPLITAVSPMYQVVMEFTD